MHIGFWIKRGFVMSVAQCTLIQFQRHYKQESFFTLLSGFIIAKRKLRYAKCHPKLDVEKSSSLSTRSNNEPLVVAPPLYIVLTTNFAMFWHVLSLVLSIFVVLHVMECTLKDYNTFFNLNRNTIEIVNVFRFLCLNIRLLSLHSGI